MQTKRLSKRTLPGVVIDDFISAVRYRSNNPITKTATIAYNLETVRLAQQLNSEGLKLRQVSELTGIKMCRLSDTIYHIDLPRPPKPPKQPVIRTITKSKLHSRVIKGESLDEIRSKLRKTTVMRGTKIFHSANIDLNNNESFRREYKRSTAINLLEAEMINPFDPTIPEDWLPTHLVKYRKQETYILSNEEYFNYVLDFIRSNENIIKNSLSTIIKLRFTREVDDDDVETISRSFTLLGDQTKISHKLFADEIGVNYKGLLEWLRSIEELVEENYFDAFGSDFYSEDPNKALFLLDKSYFYLRITTKTREKKYINMILGEKPSIPIDLPPNVKDVAKNNINCVLHCFKYATHSRLKISDIREQLNLKKNDKIDLIEKFDQLCEIFNTNISVFMLDPETFQVSDKILSSNLSFHSADCDLVVYNNHCYVREKNILVNSKKTLNIFFDIETASDYLKACVVPISIVWTDNERKIHTEYGEKCINKFISYLLTIRYNYKEIDVIGFNSARFDNWVIFEDIFERLGEKISRIFTYDGNLYFNISENISFKDSFKYNRPDKLQNLTKTNKVYKKSKLDVISFHEINHIYNKINRKSNKKGDIKAIFDIMKSRGILEKFLEYNEIDVLALRQYYEETLEPMYMQTFKRKPTECLTLGRHALDYFEKKCNQRPFKLTKDMYDSFIEAQYAGISFSSESIVNEKLYILDIISQYPTACLTGNYPKGKFHKVDKRNPTKIGVYLVKNINQSNLKSFNIVPKRTKEGYDYNYHEETINSWLCTTDVEELIKYKCKHEIEYGYEAEEIITGKELFGSYVYNFMQRKNAADNELLQVQNESKRKIELEMLRTMCKLSLNILTGKLSQKIRDKQIKVATNPRSLATILKQDNITFKSFIGNSSAVLLLQHSNPFKIGVTNTYIPLAIEIYAKARAMIHNVLEKYNIQPFVIETDSITMKQSEFDRVKNETITSFDGENIPLLYNSNNQKIFGQYELEHVFNRGISLAKKCYFLDGPDGIKYRAKGIHNNAMIYPEKRATTPEEITKFLLENNGESPFSWQNYEKLFYGKEFNIAYSNFIHNIGSCKNKANFQIRPSIGIKKIRRGTIEK